MAGNDFINYCSYCGDRSICSVEFIDPQQAEILLEDCVSAWCKDCGIDGDCPLKAGRPLKYNRVMAQLKIKCRMRDVKREMREAMRNIQAVNVLKYNRVMAQLKIKCRMREVKREMREVKRNIQASSVLLLKLKNN